MAARKILRWRKDTDQFDSLDPEGQGQGLVRTPTAIEMQRGGFVVVPDEEWDKALQDFTNRRQHVQYLAQQSAAKDTGPGMPAGRTPFFLGDKVEHPAKPGQRRDALEDTLTWAAGLGRVRPTDQEVMVGEPVVVSRTPAAPARRPEVQVGLAGQVSREQAGDYLQRAQREPLRGPAALASVYQVDPLVGDYLAQQLGGLEEAQAQARDRRLGAGISHAAAMINTALSGARHEEDAYQELERAANQPIVDYSQRRALSDRVEAEARDNAERIRKAGLDERDFRFRSEQAGRQEVLDRDRMALQERMRQDDREARARDRALQREEMRLRLLLSQRDKQDSQEAKRQDMLERQNEKDLAELAKRSQPAAEMQDDIETVRGFISKGGRDWDALPGVGPLEGLMPEWLRTHDGDRLFQSANRLAANVILAKSGKAATDAERKTLLANYGIRPGMTEDAFVSGMEALARDAQHSLANIEAGFSPDVVRQRRALGGTTAADLPSSPAPVPTGRYKRARDGRLYAEMSDGSAVEVR